ncbi:MAG: hypothetical protein QM726_16165 [Chitinophagaceae bacterium]
MNVYLQNKKAEYYFVTDDGRVALGASKTPLRFMPEMADDIEGLQTISEANKSYKQTGFIFRFDGMRIVSDIFFRNGRAGDCILTIEQDDTICGELDFATARIKGNKEISICCIHF